MTPLPTSFLSSLRDIQLATLHPCNRSALSINKSFHFEEGKKKSIDVTGHIHILKTAVQSFNEMSVEWKDLSLTQQAILKKFVRITRNQSTWTWLRFISFQGEFWKKVPLSSWLPFRLELKSAKQFDWNNQNKRKEHHLSYSLLGHGSLLLNYRLDGGKSWRCVVNPHEIDQIEIGGVGPLKRLSPSMILKEQLPAIDTVITTSFRSDHFDPGTVSFFQIYHPTFFFPSQVKMDLGDSTVVCLKPKRSSYIMMENSFGAKLSLTYFPSHCSKQGWGHAGSWVISVPNTTVMDRLQHILVLGISECCEVEDLKIQCCEIKTFFPKILFAFVPKDSLQKRSNYSSFMESALTWLKPKYVIRTHYGIWVSDKSPVYPIEDFKGRGYYNLKSVPRYNRRASSS